MGGEEAKRKSSEASPACHLLGPAAWEADRVGLRLRSGATLRHSPTRSCHLLSAAHGWCRRVCSWNKVHRLLLCSPGSKIKKEWKGLGQLGLWEAGTQQLWGAGISTPFLSQGSLATACYYMSVNGFLAAGWPLSKVLYPHLTRVRQEEEFAAVCFVSIWQGDLERGQGCGINDSR